MIKRLIKSTKSGSGSRPGGGRKRHNLKGVMLKATRCSVRETFPPPKLVHIRHAMPLVRSWGCPAGRMRKRRRFMTMRRKAANTSGKISGSDGTGGGSFANLFRKIYRNKIKEIHAMPLVRSLGCPTSTIKGHFTLRQRCLKVDHWISVSLQAEE